LDESIGYYTGGILGIELGTQVPVTCSQQSICPAVAWLTCSILQAMCRV